MTVFVLMKKIYIALFIIFIALVALMIVYQMTNPPAKTPTADYTRVKAQLLLHNYRQSAEEHSETDLQNVADHTVVYAVMVELPVYGDETGAVAEFVFFDYRGAYTYMQSDNGGYMNYTDGSPIPDISKKAVSDARKYFDNTYSRAKKSSYDVPHDGEIKIYVRAGDGVFFRTYKTEEAPAELIDAYNAALAADFAAAESEPGSPAE